jgi:hypothetical protein
MKGIYVIRATIVVILCIAFLVMFYNFTKNKHIKIELIQGAGNNIAIKWDDIKNDGEFIKNHPEIIEKLRD